MFGWLFGWRLCGLAACVLTVAGAADTPEAYWPATIAAEGGRQSLAQAPPAQGATTTTTRTTYGGWIVTCREAGEPRRRACSAEFRVINKENMGLMLVWLLGRSAGGQLVAEFVTPADIMIKPGVSVTFDGTGSAVAEFIYCANSKGCRAAVDLSPKLERDMRQASKAMISFTLANGRAVDIAVGIAGVDQALDHLKV
jgi:invasion protein IalB